MAPARAARGPGGSRVIGRHLPRTAVVLEVGVRVRDMARTAHTDLDGQAHRVQEVLGPHHRRGL